MVTKQQYRKPKLAKATQLRTCAQRAKDDPKIAVTPVPVRTLVQVDERQQDGRRRVILHLK
jgi:hypothetical protein